MGILRAVIITSIIMQSTSLALSNGANITIISINPLEQPYYIENCEMDENSIYSYDTNNKLIIYQIETVGNDSYEVNTYIETDCITSSENVKVSLSNDINAIESTSITLTRNKAIVSQDGENKAQFNEYVNKVIHKVTFSFTKDTYKYIVKIFIDDILITEYDVAGEIKYYDYFIVRVKNNYADFRLLDNYILDEPIIDTEDEEEIIEEEIIEEEIIENGEEIIEDEENGEEIIIDEEIIVTENNEDNNNQDIIPAVDDIIEPTEENIIDNDDDILLDNQETDNYNNDNLINPINNQIDVANIDIANENKSNNWIAIGLATITSSLILILLWYTHKKKAID